MKVFCLRLVMFCSLIQAALSADTKDTVITNKVLPAVWRFMNNNGLDASAPFGTNAIKSTRIDILENPTRISVLIRLTNNLNNFVFHFAETGGVCAVDSFLDDKPSVFRLMTASPKYQPLVEAESLKTNTLSSEQALELAKTYFKRNGHKEENFHPVEFSQIAVRMDKLYTLPYYAAHWWRKDVTMAQREQGLAVLARVEIYISGVKTNLAAYDRYSMPLDRDK